MGEYPKITYKKINGPHSYAVRLQNYAGDAPVLQGTVKRYGSLPSMQTWVAVADKYRATEEWSMSERKRELAAEALLRYTQDCPIHESCKRHLAASECEWRSGSLTYAEAIAEGDARQDGCTMGDTSDGVRAGND